jgi:hypothetical protein
MSGSEKISTEHEHEIHLSPVVKLLQHLSVSNVRQAQSGIDPKEPDFQADMAAICAALELNSGALFRVTEDANFDGLKLSRLAFLSSEGSRYRHDKVVPKGLEIGARSELHSLLQQEQWVPLGETCLGNETPLALRSLEEFCGVKNDSAAVLFPHCFGQSHYWSCTNGESCFCRWIFRRTT